MHRLQYSNNQRSFIMQTYSSKAAAKKGAIRKGIDISEIKAFSQDEDGRWYWKEEFVIGEFTYCPHCEIHLANGVHWNAALIGEGLEGCEKYEFLCLGCDSEFGPELKKKVPQTPKNLGGGLKIEADRQEQNGIKRPSLGGKCRAIWDFCDEFQAKFKKSPSAADFRAASRDWNKTTCAIQAGQWRKFNNTEAVK